MSYHMQNLYSSGISIYIFYVYIYIYTIIWKSLYYPGYYQRALEWRHTSPMVSQITGNSTDTFFASTLNNLLDKLLCDPPVIGEFP